MIEDFTVWWDSSLFGSSKKINALGSLRKLANIPEDKGKPRHKSGKL